MNKYQRGSIYLDKRRRCWFGRWYEDVTQKDGTVKRIQKTQRLCDYDDRYRVDSDVRPLLDEILRPLNQRSTSPHRTMALGQFVENVWLPRYVKPELKAATYAHYVKSWKSIKALSVERKRLGVTVKVATAEVALMDFTPNDAYELLRKYRATGVGRESLKHAKATLSAAFSFAVSSDILNANPVLGAKMPKTPKPPEKPYYTLEQIIDVLAALKGKLQAQAAVALTYFAGLRPSEARGCRWENFAPVHDAKTKQFDWYLTPRISVWGKQDGSLKVEQAEKPILVTEPLLSLLRDLRQHDGNPASGWILRGSRKLKRGIAPLHLDNLSRREIRPTLEAKGIDYWRGYYAGRRGIGTLSTAENSALAAKGLLRHQNLATTEAFYVKDAPPQTQDAQRRIEQMYFTLLAERSKMETEQSNAGNADCVAESAASDSGAHRFNV